MGEELAIDYPALNVRSALKQRYRFEWLQVTSMHRVIPLISQRI